MRHIKIGLKNRSKKLDHILAGPVRFAKDKNGLGYNESAASTSKTKTVPVKPDNTKRKKHVWKPQAMKTPQVSPSK